MICSLYVSMREYCVFIQIQSNSFVSLYALILHLVISVGISLFVYSSWTDTNSGISRFASQENSRWWNVILECWPWKVLNQRQALALTWRRLSPDRTLSAFYSLLDWSSSSLFRADMFIKKQNRDLNWERLVSESVFVIHAHMQGNQSNQRTRVSMCLPLSFSHLSTQHKHKHTENNTNLPFSWVDQSVFFFFLRKKPALSWLHWLKTIGPGDERDIWMVNLFWNQSRLHVCMLSNDSCVVRDLFLLPLSLTPPALVLHSTDVSPFTFL